MSGPIDDNLKDILRELRGNLNALIERGLTAKENVDDIFRDLNRIRSSIPKAIRPHASRMSKEQIIDIQSQLNNDLDIYCRELLNGFLEFKTRDLAEKAQRDPLTMLFNRAAFDRYLITEIERARRYRREISLLLFDIDFFKSINDRFGHPAGDEALRRFASILLSSLRKTDLAFRHGGDEFAAICPETSNEAATVVLQRIETRLNEFEAENKSVPPLAFSWGIASYPVDEYGAEQLVSIADQRLYVCKREHHMKQDFER